MDECEFDLKGEYVVGIFNRLSDIALGGITVLAVLGFA